MNSSVSGIYLCFYDSATTAVACCVVSPVGNKLYVVVVYCFVCDCRVRRSPVAMKRYVGVRTSYISCAVVVIVCFVSCGACRGCVSFALFVL